MAAPKLPHPDLPMKKTTVKVLVVTINAIVTADTKPSDVAFCVDKALATYMEGGGLGDLDTMKFGKAKAATK